jgi:hypothetical protein
VTALVPGCVVWFPVEVTAVILFFPKDDLFAFPMIPP